MSEIFNFLIDILDEMRADLHVDPEDIQVYAGKEIYGDLRAQRDTRPTNIHREPTPQARVSMDTEVEQDAEFTTSEAIRSHGLEIFEEPRLGHQEIILLHKPSIQPLREDMRPWIRHPDAIQRFAMSEMGTLESCRYCGDDTEYAIEGDSGEPYCSMTCLREAYS